MLLQRGVPKAAAGLAIRRCHVLLVETQLRLLLIEVVLLHLRDLLQENFDCWPCEHCRCSDAQTLRRARFL